MCADGVDAPLLGRGSRGIAGLYFSRNDIDITLRLGAGVVFTLFVFFDAIMHCCEGGNLWLRATRYVFVRLDS